jgi:hypothetical protein
MPVNELLTKTYAVQIIHDKTVSAAAAALQTAVQALTRQSRMQEDTQIKNFRKLLHRDHALQISGSRSGNKVDIATRVHIGIATGSVNKMTGNRNNAAQMEKIAASTITGINNTNKNKTSINRSFY